MRRASIDRIGRSSTRHVWFLWLFVRCLTFSTSGDTGALDLNFDPGRGDDDIVRAIAVEPGGSRLFGGSFRTFDTNACAGLVRLEADGRMDTAFAPTSDGWCNALALQTNGQLLVGGRLLGDRGRGPMPPGALPPQRRAREFAPDVAPDDSVWALAVQDDGRILVGGYLSRMGEQAVHGLTRIAVQPDGQLLLVGDFSYVNHLRRLGVARLIGHSPSVHQFIPQEMRSQEGVPQLRFDTNPDQRYTVAASPDLETWRACVSGTFSARSVTTHRNLLLSCGGSMPRGVGLFKRKRGGIEPANASLSPWALGCREPKAAAGFAKDREGPNAVRRAGATDVEDEPAR